MASYESDFQSSAKASHPAVPGQSSGVCSECGCAGVPLLLCDDLATETSAPLPHNPMLQSKNRSEKNAAKNGFLSDFNLIF